MSLLDDARRLAAEIHPHRSATQDDNIEFCVFCDGCARAGYVADHAPDCPWLALPRIVAALEAAEQLIDKEQDEGGNFVLGEGVELWVPRRAYDALVAALQEPAPIIRDDDGNQKI